MKNIVNKFAIENKYLSIPEDACGLCVSASKKFTYVLGGARLLYLLGHKTKFIDRVDGYPAINKYYFHCVVMHNLRVYDWTRKQLDPQADFPHIEHINTTRKQWLFWTTSLRYLDYKIGF